MEVPEVVIMRLPLYLRVLAQLTSQKVGVVSSRRLGLMLQMTPAQIRKDLSYFGRFGKQGRGYRVAYLFDELSQILGLDREWHVCLVGVGRLGRAIVGYPGFQPEGFSVVAAFDNDPNQVGTALGELVVRPMEDLDRVIKDKKIDIGIVAVPAGYAQEVVECLVAAGVTGILNYAPVTPQTPPTVRLRNIDPVLSLQSMTYYLRSL